MNLLQLAVWLGAVVFLLGLLGLIMFALRHQARAWYEWFDPRNPEHRP